MININQTKPKSITNKTKPAPQGEEGTRAGQAQLKNLLRSTTFYNKLDED